MLTPRGLAARSTSDSTGRAGRAALVSIERTVALVLPAVVLVQAMIAGQALFGSWDIEVHGWIGSGSFVLGAALLALAVARRAEPTVLLTAAALAIGMFAQVGLGYAGRETRGAASWHVPLGVAIFGLSVHHASGVRRSLGGH